MIPCKDCIGIAICRHKLFGQLNIECSLIGTLLYGTPPKNSMILGIRNSQFVPNVYEVRRILKPTQWTIKQRHNSTRTVDIVKRKMRRQPK